MTLQEFTRGLDGFKEKGPTEKIRLLCWYLHTHRSMDRVHMPDIGRCFDELHLARPSNLNPLVAQMVGKSLLKDARGLRLSGDVREEFVKLYGNRAETVVVDKLLTELPNRLSDPGQKEYLDEALVCFRNQAFRAACIMTWNVTYDHLATVVVTKRLADFNRQISGMFGGKKGPMATKDDFQDLKESETVEVCRAAGLVSKEVAKVLKDKLDRRNSAAHPSGSKVDKLQAEEYISNLINNAMLKIA